MPCAMSWNPSDCASARNCLLRFDALKMAEGCSEDASPGEASVRHEFNFPASQVVEMWRNCQGLVPRPRRFVVSQALKSDISTPRTKTCPWGPGTPDLGHP